MPDFTVALETIGEQGIGTASAYERLREALGPHTVGDIDDAGILEVKVEGAKDFEEALQRVWNAIATAGADDAFAFAEHPDIPEHWKRRGGDGGLPGALA